MMASKLANSSVFKAATRSYAAQAATKAAPVEGLQVSKLPSGTVVASLENNSPLARVAVFVKGGARFNSFPGASNILRLCATAGLSSEQRTGFNVVRVGEQIGAALCVNTDKEMAVYSMASSRDSVDESLSLLSTLTSNNNYRYYEFPSETYIARLKASLEISPMEQALDMVTKAAFRQQGLANSLYVPSYNVGKVTADQVNGFVQSTHGSSGVIVVGTGVDHDVLAAGAAAVGVSGGGVVIPTVTTKYYGGDLRLETGGSMAHVVVAGEGAKVGSAESLACAVAAEMLGSGSGVKHGSNASSALVRALKGASLAVNGVSNSYSDAGLLGFSVSAPAADAPKVVTSLVAAIKSMSATDKDVAGAKARVKATLTEASDGCAEVDSIGRQLMITGSYVSVADACRAVDAVSNAAVTKVLAKAFSGKLSVAAVGNINDVPYSDTM